MTLIKLRNNSGSVRSFPPVADENGKIVDDKGEIPPNDWIIVAPGSTVTISDERLARYESPAFLAAFKDPGNGRYPDLQIVGKAEKPEPVRPPSAPDAALLAQYEEDERRRLAAEEAAKAAGLSATAAAPAQSLSNLIENAPQPNPDAPAVSASAISPLDLVK